MKEYEIRVLVLLSNILTTLEQMKKQEHDYWETWKRNKEKELLKE